jgi:hypothetical protein
MTREGTLIEPQAAPLRAPVPAPSGWPQPADASFSPEPRRGPRPFKLVPIFDASCQLATGRALEGPGRQLRWVGGRRLPQCVVGPGPLRLGAILKGRSLATVVGWGLRA